MPQRMRMQLFALFAVALLAGCTATRRGVSREGATLVVDNRAFTDMTVYVVEGSSRRRLGFAPGNTTTEMAIPSTLMNRDLQLLADPLGSNRTSVSNRLFVVPGQVVTLTIPP
jgi:hypothetical protein